MKKVIFYSITALFLTLLAFSCTKNNDAQTQGEPKQEFYDGDEYDQGLVVEEPEGIEEPDPIDYEDEAATKIISFQSEGKIAVDGDSESGCSTFKYKDYLKIGQSDEGNQTEIHFTISQPDSIISVSVSKPAITVSEMSITDPTHFSIMASAISDTFKTASIRFTFMTSTSKFVSKTIKCIGQNAVGDIYGTAMWGRRKERIGLGKNQGTDLNGDAITLNSSYIPEVGDILYYGNNTEKKTGVIVTSPVLKAATRTKGAARKFKIVEWNARCNARKTTKSITMYDPTQIKSADGTTLATKYFRN